MIEQILITQMDYCGATIPAASYTIREPHIGKLAFRLTREGIMFTFLPLPGGKAAFTVKSEDGGSRFRDICDEIEHS